MTGQQTLAVSRTTMSKLSFTVRKPPATDDDKASDKFKLSALPRHLSSAASSASGTPLTGSPRTFSSREDSDEDEESGIVFADGGRKEEPDSSDDEDDRLEDELITSFNKFGAQRVNGKKAKTKAPTGPLVIPSKPNPDWREAARKRRAGSARFVPDSAKASTGADGSVGGLGTRDTINSGPQLSGIQFGNKEVRVDTSTTSTDGETTMTVDEHVKMEIVAETEDQKALRALLAGDMDSAPQIDTIPVPPSETDALQQDVASLPDVASADDYARVPITAFGAAMLRGMGWVDGGAVTSSERAKKNALVEPYLPKSRPALLGIGAKEQEVLDDGSKKKKRRGDEKRYIPLVRQESSREESRNGSATVSRRASRSPERRSGGESSRRDDRERRKDDDRDRRRDNDYDGSRRANDRDRRRDDDRDDRGARDRDDRRKRDDSRRNSDRDRDVDRRDRDRDTGREMGRAVGEEGTSKINHAGMGTITDFQKH
ncbi:DExH-box splicing factor binding site-domain-containing protein [Suillus clintonianus]|uniref:DExH-box splicing factor binding site-domain-containing protein n=1 Tax=Suillus clintonianus TaxID=1904413 RepID=UPI001B85FF97|nr:DExH-box splicing factor binding site-domain-containing protein [Suillus clintonianus]KAG2124675.1 DExH-box splicing factor binding site-domain-containing protein [Suillus clintonianus]